MAKILLAEDDENLGFMIQDNLEAEGHSVSWCKNGTEALQTFKNYMHEVCLIDVMMPKMDGFELVKNIRTKNEDIPILFLTAKSLEEDRLKGFELGADDYITKPFSIKELIYRIEVFIRRSPLKMEPPQKIYTFGNSTFDTNNLVYKAKDNLFSLTQMEAQLLHLLVTNQGELISREYILETIWGENDYFKGRSLDVFITRLRKHLKNDPLLEIRNHHGVGFSLLVK